jgi:acetylornithine deacetylase/succinyl-diaminopimelate desuccinylase-like protein
MVQPIPAGDWLTFEPEPELPGYPQLSIGSIESQSYPENHCALTLQIRLVPGQTADTVRADLEHLITEIGNAVPNITAKSEVPPHGDWNWPPYKIDRQHQLPTVLARWHEFVSGRPADVGCGPRLGAVGDANYLANAGTVAVQYGPGGIGEYDEWPAINERLKIEDLLIGARTMTLTAAEICGA